MCQEGLKQEDRDFIASVCSEFSNDSGELITVLHRVQQHFGFLPASVQHCIAEGLGIPVSKVFGVVTFYSLFTMTPKGKHPVNICTGTACYVRGAEAVLAEFSAQLGMKVGETSADGKFSLSCLRCVGACGLAPVVMVGEKIYPRVTAGEVAGILAQYEE